MGNSTTIVYEKVRQDAETIKTCSSTMNTILNDFSTAMNELRSREVFEGTASETLAANFASLRNRFDSYIATVEKFATMISSAAASTEQTEKSIASSADNLPG